VHLSRSANSVCLIRTSKRFPSQRASKMEGESKEYPRLKGVKRSILRCHSTRKRIDLQQLISGFRTMFLFRGLAAIAFGIIALAWHLCHHQRNHRGDGFTSE